MFVNNGTGVLKKVLVSKPEYLQAAPINEIAKKWDRQLDIDKMLQEHQAFIEAYHAAGVETEFLPADPERPNSVFSRDFGGCVREGYILGRFREHLRDKEHVDYQAIMEKLGVPCIVEVKEGLFEGGDFMFLNEHTIALGMFARTNQRGFEEVRDGLAPYGYEVITVPGKEEYLHLDMCFNLVDDHLAVAYRAGMPEEFLARLKKMDIEIIPVEEEAIFAHGCNLQALGGHRVLSLARNTRVNAELRRRGMEVIELPITEILKAGGGPHCMTFPLSRE